MTLKTGTQLGPYEILSPLGAGGMGEVYLATDSKLDRKVAIKVLPESMTRDKERVARFEREAKLLASLNHPNIAAIHGFDDSGGTRFLVMEYVEGKTLRSHLKTGPVAVEDALDIAKQIAEALEAAHEQGIIHRDLKPANVMIREDGTVKVLDFGLAKAMTNEPSGPASANSPTITANFTRPGVVLGTAAYMSPEQARGHALDKRTDIWSFGILLFECLTGHRLFQGETANDSMGAIMHKDPEWSLLPPSTPPTIQLLLRRCLTKDRKRRLHDIADARIELENAIVDPTASSLGLASAALQADRVGGTRGFLRRALPSLTVVLAISLGVSILAPRFWNTAKPQMPVQLNVEISPDVPLWIDDGAQTILSPDGTRLVTVAGPDQNRLLYTRRLDRSELTALSGTEGARQPFFSPDGRWIGFFANRKLKKVSVSGGEAISLCDAAMGTLNLGGTWGADGTIIFVPNLTTGLWRVSDAGGTPQQITKRAKGERTHRWPFFLPGGRAVLFTSQTVSLDFDQANIEVLNLETKERRVLQRGGSYGRYLPTGHLVFVQGGTLFAVAMDPDTLRVQGSPVPVLEDVTSQVDSGGAEFAFSDTGVLVYRPGEQGTTNTSVVWVDRAGQTTPLLETPGNYSSPRLSPDGTKLALGQYDRASADDIRIYDIQSKTLSRLTLTEGSSIFPTWSPDGSRIYFSSDRDTGTYAMFWKPADGTGIAERLTTSDEAQFTGDYSPDTPTILFVQIDDEIDPDIMTLALDKDAQPEVFLQTQFAEGFARFSPDGRWIVYASNESGRTEIFVRPFKHGGGKWQVSTDGGRFPNWSPDGKELFYRKGKALMVVAVTTEGSTFQPGTPTILFELESGGVGIHWPYDVAPDGKRFVWFKNGAPQGGSDDSHVRFILNWFDDVKAKVSTDRK